MELIKKKNFIFSQFNNIDNKNIINYMKMEHINEPIGEIDIEEIDSILLKLLEYEEIKQIYKYQYKNNVF